ncbi:MAG: YbaB/EbfC family nucleoid-associated protein [Clostridia bacterium]|nr:YbaB/EbfC family nucleoid-associated protein [Clostridia bacterium]
MKVRLPQNNGPANMQGMIRQAQKMQEDMAAAQAELETREYEVSAGGGVVTVKINGKREILALNIEPDVVDPDDVETLSDIVMAAVNEAIRKVDTAQEEEMAKFSGQMGQFNLPGLF